MDLINRQDAIDAIEKLDIPEDMCVFEILSHIELAIGTLPSAERKRGEWVLNDDQVYECKDCGYVPSFDGYTYFNYCPNCGARMEGEENVD